MRPRSRPSSAASAPRPETVVERRGLPKREAPSPSAVERSSSRREHRRPSALVLSHRRPVQARAAPPASFQQLSAVRFLKFDLRADSIASRRLSSVDALRGGHSKATRHRPGLRGASWPARSERGPRRVRPRTKSRRLVSKSAERQARSRHDQRCREAIPRPVSHLQHRVRLQIAAALPTHPCLHESRFGPRLRSRRVRASPWTGQPVVERTRCLRSPCPRSRNPRGARHACPHRLGGHLCPRWLPFQTPSRACRPARSHLRKQSPRKLRSGRHSPASCFRCDGTRHALSGCSEHDRPGALP